MPTSAVNDVVDATGDAGLGELYCGVPGATAVDELTAAGVSKVSLTVWSMVWNSSRMRSRKGCTLLAHEFRWFLSNSIMIFMQSTALSSFSMRASSKSLSTICGAY